MSNLDLKSLGDPNSDYKPLDLSVFQQCELIPIYRKLLLIRKAEQVIAEGRRHGLIGGPVHLGIGQEAVAVGICSHLTPSDSLFSAHRSHSQLLALGSDPYRLFAEVLGKSTGLSGGRGGSMHLIDQSVGFSGSVPIVAGTVPLAVGAGLAKKKEGKGNISVAFFGDGAVEEGVVFESFNLASLLKLPVLFVIENNLYSSHMHIKQRQVGSRVARFAESHGIHSITIDGNDVAAVFRESKALIDKCRSLSKPAVIEAVTFRHLGHVDWREDVDVGISRSSEELAAWKELDPISRLKNSIVDANMFSDDYLLSIENEIHVMLEQLWLKAKVDSPPNPSTLFHNVFKEGYFHD